MLTIAVAEAIPEAIAFVPFAEALETMPSLLLSLSFTVLATLLRMLAVLTMAVMLLVPLVFPPLVMLAVFVMWGVAALTIFRRAGRRWGGRRFSWRLTHHQWQAGL
jgi:hypothetical protein